MTIYTAETSSSIQLWTTVPIVHVALFLFVIDLYFKTSPRRHGKPVQTLSTPFADRMVLFIVNDISPEELFSSDSRYLTPHLEGLRRRHKASWGNATVKEPDDAHSGIAAILGGLFEKPKVRLMDWLIQKRPYDTIVERSKHSWIAGVPYGRHIDEISTFRELISMLKWRESACSQSFINLKWKQFLLELKRLEIGSRRLLCEKFAADTMAQTCLAVLNSVDAYVLVESMKTEGAVRRHFFLCRHEKIHCSSLYSKGNLFVVFLSEDLSWRYKLTMLDATVKISELAMNQFFEDSNTAYMVVSAKSKGKLVPYVLWGKGVVPEVNLKTISQTDFAPLIATLLGVNIPINSEGILPYQLLKGSKEQVLNATLTNTNQLLEQFRYIHKEIFHRPPLGNRDVYCDIVPLNQSLTNNLNISENSAKINFVSAQIALMVSFLQRYHYPLKLFAVQFGYIFWLVYLGFEVYRPLQDEHAVISPFARRIAATVMNMVMLCIAGCMFYFRYSLMAYVYLVFIFGMMMEVLESDALVVFMTMARSPSYEKTFFHTVKYFILTELLVLGVCKEVCLGIPLLVVAAWTLILKDVSIFMKCMLCSMIVIMVTLRLLPPTSIFCHYGWFFGMAAWIVYQICVTVMTLKKLNCFQSNRHNLIGFYAVAFVPFLLYLLGAVYIILDGWDKAIAKFGLKFPAVLLSILSAALTCACPTNILLRIQHVCMCLAVPMLLTSVHSDMIYYTALSGALFVWIQIEGQVCGVDAFSKDFREKVQVEQRGIGEHDFRRVFFFLSFTICSVFSLRHMSNTDKLRLLWNEDYPWNYDTILVLMVGAFKSCIPVFLTSYALYATNVMSRTKTFTYLTINLLYMEIMIMTSIFLFGNNNLTKSLNRFVLLNLLAALIIIMYVLVKCTTFCGIKVALHVSELKKHIFLVENVKPKELKASECI